MEFDHDWAEKKLDMVSRYGQIEKYVAEYLPELKYMEPGLVIDIGPGPGDFLAMCESMGHSALGIDGNRDGMGGMGEAYISLCEEYWEEFGVDVWQCGLDDFLFSDDKPDSGSCCLINSRGSIEQAMSHCLVGSPHHEHHKATLLDWNKESGSAWLESFFYESAKFLRPGGILLIHANGTHTTDGWYSNTVVSLGKRFGFDLSMKQSHRLHKWTLSSN